VSARLTSSSARAGSLLASCPGLGSQALHLVTPVDCERDSAYPGISLSPTHRDWLRSSYSSGTVRVSSNGYPVPGGVLHTLRGRSSWPAKLIKLAASAFDWPDGDSVCAFAWYWQRSLDRLVAVTGIDKFHKIRFATWLDFL
jgi:hypothetical protein